MIFGRKKIRSEELKVIRRKRHKKLLILGLIFFFLLVVAASAVPRLEPFLIKNVVVAGNAIESSENITTYVKNELKGNYLLIIPKENWIFYPKKGLEEGLLREFKRLYLVEVTYEGNNSILVDVRERKPDWIWCAESCYFMDTDGLIFAKAPNFSGPVFFKVKGAVNIPVGANVIGNYFLPPWQISDMKAFVVGVEELGLIPISLEVTAENDTEVFLKEGFFLKLGKDKPLALTLQDLKDAVSAGLLEKKEGLSYIDLRFENKVFYK